MAAPCQYCGCTSFHFNSRRLLTICDSCGMPQSDPRQASLQRALNNAAGHLRAGSWDGAFRLLQPFAADHPTDITLHTMLIKAVTQDFTVLPSPKSPQARSGRMAWDRLAHLGRLNDQVLQYGRLVSIYWQNRLKKRLLRARVLLILSGVFFVLLGITFSLDMYIAAFISVVAGISLLYYCWAMHPLQIVRQLNAIPSLIAENPFHEVNE